LDHRNCWLRSDLAVCGGEFHGEPVIAIYKDPWLQLRSGFVIRFPGVNKRFGRILADYPDALIHLCSLDVTSPAALGTIALYTRRWGVPWYGSRLGFESVRSHTPNGSVV